MSTAVARFESRTPSIFPSESDWAMLKEQAMMAVKSGLLPNSIKTPEQAIVIALKGRELGIPPMQAFAHIHIIQGKPCISSELMLSLIFKNCHGAVVDYLETSNTRCRIKAKRPGGQFAEFEFSIEDAKQAGLTNKDSWRNYPGAMLRARTISMTARALFADAIMGCSYTPEELGAEVDDDGEVISLDGAPPKAPDPVSPPKIERPYSSDVAAARVVIRTRAVIGDEIKAIAEKMGVGTDELHNWATEHTGKKPADMKIEDMERFLTMLQEEAGRNGVAV